MMSKDGMTAPYVPQIALYRRWLRDQRGLSFSNYEEMRQWSVGDIDAFWQSIWDYFDLRSPTPHSAVLAQRKMPGAAGQPAMVSSGEDGLLKETSWPELRRKAAALAVHLQRQGVGRGDRVAA